MKKAPTNALTLIGAVIYTAEAMKTAQVHYRLPGCGSQEEIHSDVSFVQDRNSEGR